MVDIKKILKSVVQGSSERAGCSDGEIKEYNQLVKLAESKKSEDHEKLYRLVFEKASYG